MLLFLLMIACQSFYVEPKLINDFKLVKKKGDILLYERWVTNSAGQNVRELKAEFSLHCEPVEAYALLRNAALGKQWNENAAAYKIISTSDSFKWINYIKYNMPAFVDDQDCCLLFQAKKSINSIGEFYEINFESTGYPDFAPIEKVKRITGVKGLWQFRKTPSGNVAVTYLISSDRNSKIPRFISDPLVQNNLCTSMENFKKILEK